MHLLGSGLISPVGYSVWLKQTLYPEIRSLALESHRVLFWVRRFIACTPKPVSDIIQRHGLNHHSYADDTHLYMTMDHSNNNWRDGLARIQLCVSEIREWMTPEYVKAE